MEEKTPYDDAIDEAKQAIEDFIPRPNDDAIDEAKQAMENFVPRPVDSAQTNARRLNGLMEAYQAQKSMRTQWIAFLEKNPEISPPKIQ